MGRDTARQAWDERYSARDYVWTVEANQFVEAELSDLAPGEAIDLGAGEGRNAVWLALRGWKVTAVDFSPVGLEKAARLAADNDVSIEIVEADATTYRPQGLVDLVAVSYLQLPPDGRRAVLEHAKTWLRPGGTVFVIAHDRRNISDGYGGPSSPEVCYSVDETVAALDGLEIEIAEVVGRTVTTESGEQTALDTLVKATLPAA